jgi:hypothetical protein
MSDDFSPVDESEFTAMVNARSGALLDVAGRLAAADPETTLALLTRPMVAFLHSQGTQLEELLDAYGALRNQRWRPFRRWIAAVKLFSRVHYSLVHLVRASPQYRLLCDDDDLNVGLDQALRFTARVLHLASRRVVDAAPSLGLAPRPADVCEEVLPPGVLPRDCPLRRVQDVAEAVTRLASAFLNLAGGATPLSRAASTMTTDRRSTVLPTENELRVHAEDFHNLQALYDTHVAQTDAELADTDLLSLRGHASVVFHLLEAATELLHYHERHVAHASPVVDRARIFADQPGCIEPQHLDWISRDLLVLAARYVQVGRTLSQQLLRRYAVQGEITVPIPRYRGFHVRPSTLVAKVAYHYGSAVSMTLEGETYDASSPLELFRANEAINARKRRWLAQEIGRLVDCADEQLGDDLIRTVRSLLVRLSEEGKVVLYEQPLPAIESQPGEGQPVLRFIVDAVARLLALGKIDIIATVTATFRGDRRVLADLELLAENGYGEDAYGNNIPLPDALSYLRR